MIPNMTLACPAYLHNFVPVQQMLAAVLAQELQTVFPSMVTTDQDEKLGVKYSVFVPILIKALQELSDKVLILENK
jgi:hypothetical protein